jgi:hypothetical protein
MSEDRVTQEERAQPTNEMGTKQDDAPPSVNDRERTYRRIGQGWSAWGTTLVA